MVLSHWPCILVIFQLSVSVVLARGLVCDELKLVSQQDQLVIIEMVPYRTLEILADSCQADMVTYLTLASEVSLSQQDQLVIIEMVPYRTLEILADSCQADMVTYLTLASEVSLSQQDQLVIIEMVPYRTLEILADNCQADISHSSIRGKS